jgi:hypothetical protein
MIAANGSKAKEIKDEIRTLEREIEQLQRTNLILRLGRLQFQRNINAQDAAKAFVAFHLMTIIAGSILIFQPSPMKELGIALVVGGLFAFGTFLSSIWEKVYDAEQALYEDAPSRRNSRSSIDIEELISLLEELREHRRNLTRQPAAIQTDHRENEGMDGNSHP